MIKTPRTYHPRRHRHSYRLAAVTSAVLASSGAAHADPGPAPSSGGGLEEIIITAQKRSENLQSVPISVQAIDTKRLEELKITDFNAVAKYLPSVSFQTYGPGQAQIYFRGITNGTDGNRVGSSPMVGVYLDEQPVTTIGNSLDVHIYDMARIEALSGPQGTLFGANSMEGTLRYITNKPDHTGLYGGYDISVSRVKHGGTGEKIEGFLNVPINDYAAIRLVGFGERDAGFIDNVAGPAEVYPTSGIARDDTPYQAKAFNRVGTSGGRAALKIDLNDRWTVTPTAMFQKQGAPGSFAYQPSVGDLAVAQYGPNNNTDQWYQSALTIEGKIGNFDLTYSGGYMRRTIDNVFDYSDYSYGYDVGYTGFGSLFQNNKQYSEQCEYEFYSAAGLTSPPPGCHYINPAQYVVSHDLFTKRTHELRIASPATDRFRFVLGVFYQEQRNDSFNQYRVTGLADILSVTGQPGVHYLDAVTRYDTDRAAFTEMNYNITDHLIATGGVRVFDYRTVVSGFFGFPAYPLNPDGSSYYNAGESQCNPVPTIPLNSTLPCLNVNARSAGGKYTDKYTLTYKFDPDRLVYATYSTGFRPGGINRNPNVAPYKPDYLDNLELGWKTSWLGHTLRVNGALFREQWKDAQFGVSGQYAITQILNSGGAETEGIESEIEWVPMDGLTISTSETYLWKHQMVAASCQNAPSGPNCATGTPPAPDPGNILAPSGATTPVAPAFKGNLTFRYDFSFSEMKAHAQASGLYQTSVIPYLSTVDEAVLGKQPGYGTVDLTTGVSRSNWTMELSLENAFDERGQLTRYLACSSSYCTIPYVVPVRPRTLSLQFGQKF